MTTHRNATALIALTILSWAASAISSGQTTQVTPDSAPAKSSKPVRGASPPTRPNPVTPMLERSLGWTGGILAVGACALILSRKLNRSAGLQLDRLEDRPRITSRVQLTPRQAVHVVRIGSRTLVIGTGSQGAPVALAHWHDDSSETGIEELAGISDSCSADAFDPNRSISPEPSTGATK